VRRLAIPIYALLLLSACGPKKVQVNIPTPASASSDELEGFASYYAEPYQGRRTASGEIFDSYKDLSAAHRTLPFNTVVRVTNKNNGRQVDVKINDRGPFIDGRVIDVSYRAARDLDMIGAGVIPVKIKILKAGEAVRATVYAVQIGAFENARAAEDLRQQLERKYPSVTVQTLPGEKTIYRVRIGRESDIEAAQKLAAELRKDDLKPFVVRVN
jgi:rare lipoprotein A